MQAFRTTLAADPDRDWTYLWSRSGMPVPLSMRVSPADQWWDQQFHGGFRLPKDAKPGPLVGPVPLSVVVPPDRKAKTIPAGPDTTVRLKDAFAGGFLDLTLAAGEHLLKNAVATPPWAVVRGYGATVRVLENKQDENRAVVPGPYLSVYGVTFVADLDGKATAFHTFPDTTGLVVADCTFKRLNFGWGTHGCLVRDCHFVNAAASLCPPGCWLRCRWDGIAVAGHAFHFWGGGPLCLIDAVFSGTDRGPCFNTDPYGPVNDNLFLNTAVTGINHTATDGESFSVEGSKPFDRNLILRYSHTNCRGACVQLDRVARDNLYDFHSSGGLGVRLGSPWTDIPGKDVSNNTFGGYDPKTVRFEFGPAAVNNVTEEAAVGPA